jgi:hypothetical protein
MKKTEPNETQSPEKADIKGFIDDLKDKLKEKKIIDLKIYGKKLLAILKKKPNKPVLVKELFPNFETGKKDYKFLKSLADNELVRPLCGGPWKVDSTIVFTRKGRDLARKHKIPVIPLVFVSYSHKDVEWKNLLESHLRVLEQYFHMETWDDEQIPAGKDFKDEIFKALELADAAILLISADFLSSGFIKHEEIPRIFEDKARDVFPILLRPCAWNLVNWLNQIQVRLAEGKALSEWTEGKMLSEIKHPAVEKCFASITEEIASRLKLIR